MKIIFNLLILITITKPIVAQNYQLTSESEIKFEVKHMGVFNVNGKFKDFSGQMYYQSDSLSGTGSIMATSVITKNKSRDKDLRGEGIFNVEQYPEILFEVLETFKKDEISTMKARLTIKDISHDLTFPYELVQTGKGVLIELETVVDRTDFDLNFDSLDGLVGNEVKLNGYLLFESE